MTCRQCVITQDLGVPGTADAIHVQLCAACALTPLLARTEGPLEALTPRRCREDRRCYGDGIPNVPHTCPYASEIHDDEETLCTCCDGCTRECADDV